MIRLRSIDALRGIAATLVVLRHSYAGFAFGSIGVDFFFVISGFIMAKLSLERTPKQFLRDRAWRIFPIYWVLVSYTLAAGLWKGQSFNWFAANLILVSRWFGFTEFAWGITWTLCYELAFYCLVALGMKLGSYRVPLAIFALCVIARPFINSPLVDFFGSPIAVEFLFGVAIARLPKCESYGMPMAGIGILWLALFPNGWIENMELAMSYELGALRVLVWGIPAALIVYGCLSNERRFGRWATPLVWLGLASYSIYLIHLKIIEVFNYAPSWLLAVSSIWIGFAAWYFIEKPLLRLPKVRLSRSKKQPRQQST